MERAIADRLINDYVAVTDLNIVQARRVGANPRLVLNGSSLATEIRKRYQITFTTFATPGKCVFHEIASFLLLWRYYRLTHKCQTRLSEKVSRWGSLRRCIRIPTAGLIHAFTIIPQLFFSVSRYVKKSSYSLGKRYSNPFTITAHTNCTRDRTKGIAQSQPFHCLLLQPSPVTRGLLLLIFSITGVTRLVKHVYVSSTTSCNPFSSLSPVRSVYWGIFPTLWKSLHVL